MNKFELKQVNIKKSIPVALIYLLAVFGFCYVQFDGISGMADSINSMGNATGSGFVVGLVVLVPFFAILKMISTKVTVEVDSNNITITYGEKAPIRIEYENLKSIELNKSKVGKLDFKDKNNEILCSLEPKYKNEILGSIIEETSKHIDWNKQLGSKSMLGKTIETVIYTKS